MMRISLKTKLRIAVVPLVLATLGPAAAATAFTLTSTSFADGGLIPKKLSNTGGPTCSGDNLSPELSWFNPPAGTKSFVLTMIDPEGRNGLGVIHWIAYGIAPDSTSFPEGAFSRASNKFVGGKGTRGADTYLGPCPPPSNPHHYTITVMATDLGTRDLPAGLTLQQLQEKLDGHAKAATALVGLFGSP